MDCYIFNESNSLSNLAKTGAVGDAAGGGFAILDLSFRKSIYCTYENGGRTMGRYKEFDKEAVLHKAMLVFWKKGYEATSIPDLLEAMDLSRSSLYETFGDKQTLYIEAINWYKKWKQAKRDILVNATSAKSGIRQYFEIHIDSALDGESPKGCLITNAAVGMDSPDEQLNTLIRERFDELEKSFYELLRKGQETGEIMPEKDIKTLSYLLSNLNHSINIVAKVQGDRRKMQQMIDMVMEIL